MMSNAAATHRPLLLQGVVLAFLMVLHALTALDRWLLALLGMGLLLAVELLALPLPPKGLARWVRQLGWLAAVFLVMGVSLQLYFWRYATTLQRLGMGMMVLYSWAWAARPMPSIQQRAPLALLLALSLTALLGIVYEYMHGGSQLIFWIWVASVGSVLGAIALALGRDSKWVPLELWWRSPQWMHLLLLMLTVWLEVWGDPRNALLLQ